MPEVLEAIDVHNEPATSAQHAQKWAVLGGGMLGMTIAHRLAQEGHRVTLIEGRPGLGGLADAWQLGEITWDRHYHVTLLSDLHLRGLLRELGLEQEMNWVETRTGFYTDGDFRRQMEGAFDRGDQRFLKLPVRDAMTEKPDRNSVG